METKTTIAQRIEKLIDELGMNKNSFSRAIGLDHNTTIGQIIKKGSNPSWDVFERIIATYPNISLEWITQGEGPMFVDEKRYKKNKIPASLAEEPSPTLSRDNGNNERITVMLQFESPYFHELIHTLKGIEQALKENRKNSTE